MSISLSLTALRVTSDMLHQYPRQEPNIDGNHEKKQEIPKNGADSGAFYSESAPLPSDLAEVVAAWPNLSDALKAGILAMVRASVAPANPRGS